MTKISDKKIPVYFSMREFLGSRCQSKLMGMISYEDVMKIMVAMEDHKPSPNECIHDLGFKYTAELSNFAPSNQRHHFKIIDDYWGYNKFFPKSAVGTSVKPPKEVDCMFFCANCLAAGKCQDAFMRKTIGAVLFPKLYTKEK